MNNYTYTYTCRNIFNTIRTSEDTSLEKYTSHFIERDVCERELEAEQNCNILTPTLMAITAFLSRSPELLNQGIGAQLSVESWAPTWTLTSSSELQLLNRVSWGCRVLVLSTASYFQLTRTSCAPSYIIVLCPLNSTRRQSRLSPDILDRMHLLFTKVHFLFWQLGRVGGQYTTYADVGGLIRNWLA